MFIDSFIIAFLQSIVLWLLSGSVGISGLVGFTRWLDFFVQEEVPFPEQLQLIQQKENGQCNKGKCCDVIRILYIIRGCNRSGK